MRLKIIAGNLAVVVLLGLAAYLTVDSQLRTGLVARLDSKIGNDRLLFERSYRLSALEFQSLVAQRANSRPMRDVFAGLDLDSRRTRAFEAATATHAWFGDPARGGRGAPELVVVVDETGKALARNGARNVMFGKALLPSLPALGRVLKGSGAVHDVWLEDQQKKVLQTVAAPIRADSGAVLGALVVGYDLSNGMASLEAKVLGRDVAFLVEDNVYSSSLGAASRDLKGFLFGPAGAATKAALQGGSSQPWTARLGGSEYRGVTSRLPMSPSLPVAFAVMGNRTEAMALASVSSVILILLVVGAVLVIGYGFVIGGSLLSPIEKIEEGVLAVINGRTDLRLEPDSPELGGLAYRINQLLNVFTGTEEGSEDDEGRVSVAPSAGHWQDAAFADGSGGGGGGAAPPAAAGAPPDEPIDDDSVSSQLAAEEEAAYNERVYKEYVAAKQALGENVANIPKDRFNQRLAGRAKAEAKKHGCRLVRFQVQTRNNQVVLRPVLIR